MVKKRRKVVGILFVVLGILILITPFTPGSVLLVIGLDILLGHKVKWWIKIKKKFFTYTKWK